MAWIKVSINTIEIKSFFDYRNTTFAKSFYLLQTLQYQEAIDRQDFLYENKDFLAFKKTFWFLKLQLVFSDENFRGFKIIPHKITINNFHSEVFNLMLFNILSFFLIKNLNHA